MKLSFTSWHGVGSGSWPRWTPKMVHCYCNISCLNYMVPFLFWCFNFFYVLYFLVARLPLINIVNDKLYKMYVSHCGNETFLALLEMCIKMTDISQVLAYTLVLNDMILFSYMWEILLPSTILSKNRAGSSMQMKCLFFFLFLFFSSLFDQLLSTESRSSPFPLFLWENFTWNVRYL